MKYLQSRTEFVHGDYPTHVYVLIEVIIIISILL